MSTSSKSEVHVSSTTSGIFNESPSSIMITASITSTKRSTLHISSTISASAQSINSTPSSVINSVSTILSNITAPRMSSENRTLLYPYTLPTPLKDIIQLLLKSRVPLVLQTGFQPVLQELLQSVLLLPVL